jgi:hypothetical protein
VGRFRGLPRNATAISGDNLMIGIAATPARIGGHAAETSGKSSPGPAKTARKTESRRLAPTAGLCKEKPRAEWGLDEGLIGALGLGARISAPNPQTPPAVGPPAAPGSLEDASSPAGLHQPKSLGGGLRQPNSRQFRVGAVALRGNHRILLTRSNGRS